MSKHLFITVCLAALTAVSLGAQVIAPPSERDELLSGMRQVLSNTEGEGMDFSAVQSPFHERTEANEPAAAKQAQSSDSPTPVILSDDAALRLIGQRFKPLGSLVIGDRGILQLSNGETIAEGEIFSAQIQGTRYPVVIEEVTRNMYRLRLGSATLEKSFLVGDSQ